MFMPEGAIGTNNLNLNPKMIYSAAQMLDQGINSVTIEDPESLKLKNDITAGS